MAAPENPRLAQARQQLWSADVGPAQYGEDAERAYQAAILDQYKLYVEMADRISQRRGLTNTFFLTLNTAIFTIVGVFWKDRPRTSEWALLFPLVVALGQCAAWYLLVQSYKKLNGIKFVVVAALEERLPASPYWRAEWQAIGQGEDRSKYWPLSHIESWVPALFALTYVAAVVTAIVA